MVKNNHLFRSFLFTVLLGLLGFTKVIGQNGQNMKIHFVAPAAIITANFPGHANGSYFGLPAGYDIAEITASNAARFQSLAPPQLLYVYQQLQSGTTLRTRLNEVQTISRDSVQVNYYLIDDRTGININAKGNITAVHVNIHGTRNNDGLYHVWPSGNGFNLGDGTYQGRVRLGEYQLSEDQSRRSGGALSVQEVILHESFHTQLVDRWTKWPGYITYGNDENHYQAEILGDQETAFNEGAGTFFGYTVNAPGLATMDTYFTDPGYRYFLEAQSVCAGYRELYTVAARQQRTMGNGVTVFDYRWSDVPGFFCMFNENNATCFFANYWRNALGNTDSARAFLNFAFHAMWKDTLKRYLSYAVNRLALKMESYSATAAGRADTSKTSSMFPFALLDLITHFGMTETEYKEDYRRNYPDREPLAFTQYWTHRAAVRQLVSADMTATPIRFSECINKIKTYFKQPATILVP